MNKGVFEQIKNKAEPILRNHDVEFAGVFGSFARGETRPASDIDFVIRYAVPKGLFDLVGLAQELSDTLDRKVDIVSEKAVHPYLKKNIVSDLQIMYGQRRYL